MNPLTKAKLSITIIVTFMVGLAVVLKESHWIEYLLTFIIFPVITISVVEYSLKKSIK